MKPHPGIRKTVKWGGAAVTVLLVVVWIGSGWWVAGWSTNDAHCFQVSAGRFIASYFPSNKAMRGWTPACGIFPLPSAFEWSPAFNSHHGGWGLLVPLWIPTLSTSAASVLAWRLDTLARRRARLNLCPQCH